MNDVDFPDYGKIQGLYKRDGKGNFILGNYSLDVFRYLEDDLWRWTEKVDGTNIRLYIDPKLEALELSNNISPPFSVEPEVRIGGHHANSQIPGPLNEHLLSLCVDYDRIQSTLEGPVVLYGEGYGGKIQSGAGVYGYPEAQTFILFDVWVPEEHHRLGGYWLDHDKVRDIGNGLEIPTVPAAYVNGSLIGLATLKQAVYDVRYHGIPSQLGRQGAQAEGIVGVPATPLFDRMGHRIITKIKHRDFDFLNDPTLKDVAYTDDLDYAYQPI
jgi:hypothetical protein